MPKFNSLADRGNGLVSSVHATWATHISLKSLEVSGTRFRATVHYRIQDHFELDGSDILNPIYQQLRIFRIWFILQRWREYGYRPFITEINAVVTIEGMQND